MFFTNGKVKIYYEKQGSGAPLILLHGNGESHKIFNRAIPLLAEHFTVYAVDSRDHGKSTKVKSLSYIDIADDIIAMIKDEHIERPMLYGFSDGGIVGLLIAIKEPDLLSKLAVSGANISPKGLSPLFLLGVKAKYHLTHSQKCKMMAYEPNISEKELEGIKTKVLILAGEHDLIRPKHTKLIAKSIPGAGMRIIKGHSHGSYIVNSTIIADILLQWL